MIATLALAMGVNAARADVVKATVSFSPANAGLPLNPAFVGLSYEKLNLTKNFFTSNNVPLVKLFSLIGPAVLRIGGGTSDSTCWGGRSNLTPITAAQVDALAGFMKALPTNWSVIYGINFSVNNPTNCAAEAAYVANALGPRLLGFEIGNEPEAYPYNGIRSPDFTYTNFVTEWRPLANAVIEAVPGWAMTHGGLGWVLTGPASGGNPQWTKSFAHDEAGVISLATQHYYREDGKKPRATLQLLLQPDPKIAGAVSKVVSAVKAAKLPLGFCEDECGSFSHGGVGGASDVYGAALWSLDFMFTLALNGCEGVNLHGGGRSPYTPLFDSDGKTVTQVRPEFYGLKMFSLLPRGNVVPAKVALPAGINFAAYGVRCAPGRFSAPAEQQGGDEHGDGERQPGAEGRQRHLDGTDGAGARRHQRLHARWRDDQSGWFMERRRTSGAAGKKGRLTVTVPPISAFLLVPVASRNQAGDQRSREARP